MTTTPCDFIDLTAPGIRALRPYQPGKPEDELRREYGLSSIVKLASNENPLGPSPLAMAAVRDGLSHIARYPDGNGFELKTALALHHRVSPEQITLGNGSNEVLELVARTFLTPDHEAVFSEHAFAVYPLATQAVGATARIAGALSDDQAMPYGHDLTAIERCINQRTRVIFLANPNNPTGTWLTTGPLQAFLEYLPRQIMVVVDEAYFEYVDEVDYPNTIPWIERFPNLIVTRTFSKAHGLAGLRVGYGVSHPQVAELLNRVRQPFNVNELAMVGAVAALGDIDHLRQSLTVNRTGKQQFQEMFNNLGLGYLPSAGNFLCVEVGRPGREVFQNLLAQGVIVRPVDNYNLPHHLRISIGNGWENQRCIQALASVLKN